MTSADQMAAGWKLGVGSTPAAAAGDGAGGRPVSVRRLEALRRGDDVQLVDACVAGEPEAFEVIVERYRRRLYLLCYRFAGEHEDASDLAQEALVRAYRGIRRFRRQASLSTWLHRIAVNVCLSRVAARKPTSELLQPDRIVDTRANDPADGILHRERSAQLKAAIARLPKRQRAVVVLRVYHDLPHEEIARILGSSVGAVKVNFCHALGRLRRDVGPGVAGGLETTR